MIYIGKVSIHSTGRGQLSPPSCGPTEPYRSAHLARPPSLSDGQMVGGSVDRKQRLVQFCLQRCSLRVLTWAVALSSAAWSSYVYWDRSFHCPEGTVCIEGDRFGKGPPVTPYAEFTEVTNSHAVYRVSALLKTEQSPYQLVQAYQSHFFGKILVIDGALVCAQMIAHHSTPWRTPWRTPWHTPWRTPWHR